MLFCTQPFLVFFIWVFLAYWVMERRWPRLAVLAAAALFFLRGTWKAVLAWDAIAATSGYSFDCLWEHLASRGVAYAVAGIVTAALAASLKVGHQRGRVFLLLAASFYFYASWNKWLALLIVASTALDYLLARGMDAAPSPRLRKLLLAVSVTANLGLLCYFKYANFFLHSLEEALRAAGAPASLPVLKVLLPVGISFYTFEAISYTADVYRRRIPAERNLTHFMLFILFFPHLVAGPIVRARDFLPQVHRRKRWSWPRLQLGVQLFLMGLFKKLVIADRMPLWGDPVFDSPQLFGSYATWSGLVAFAVQLYCDFSGYSDMALGCAHLLGYKLTQNFNMPYLATSVNEYWRRWHMSLGSWLRDYLFIPLGGSRHGRRRTYRNSLIIMTLMGLWHGATWSWVLWGVLQGVLLIANRILQGFCKARPRLDRVLQSWPGTVARWAATLVCVTFGYVIFRAPTFGSAARIYYRLLTPVAGRPCQVHSAGLWLTVLLMAACHAAGHFGLWKRSVPRLPAPVLGFGYAAALFLTLLLNLDTGNAFIYFQF